MAPCRINAPARMAESADAAASKAVVRKDVRVQVPLRARTLSNITAGQTVTPRCETTRSAVRDYNVVTTGDLKLPQLVMKAGRPCLATRPERLAALEDLSSRMRSGGNDVDLQITDRVQDESVSASIRPRTLQSSSAAAWPTRCFRDSPMIYELVKLWAIARFHRKVEVNRDGPHKPETFTIYGPDNEVL
jgi:hypothetical protein